MTIDEALVARMVALVRKLVEVNSDLPLGKAGAPINEARAIAALLPDPDLEKAREIAGNACGSNRHQDGTLQAGDDAPPRAAGDRGMNDWLYGPHPLFWMAAFVVAISALAIWKATR